jgi:hypothetical protein
MRIIFNYLFLFMVCLIVIETLYRRALKGNPEVDIAKYVRAEAGEVHLEFRNLRLQQMKKNRKFAYLIVAAYAINFWALDEFVPSYIFWLLPLVLVTFLVQEDQAIALKKEMRFIEKLADENDRDSHAKLLSLKTKRSQLSKNTSIVLGAGIVLSFYWFYQIDTSFKESKEVILQNAIELQGKDWCLDFETKWPCIRIANVSEIVFIGERRGAEACSYISLERDQGLPGSNWSREDTFPDRYCLTFGEDGWSQDFEDLVSQQVAKELPKLKENICNQNIHNSRLTLYDSIC